MSILSIIQDHHISFFASLSCFGWIGAILLKHKFPWLGNCMSIVYHISLAPVIAALPAPEWVKMAGYFWVFVDSLIDVAIINKLSEEKAWILRLGAHLPASVWIIGCSIGMVSWGLWTGVSMGVLLCMHAIIDPQILSVSKFKLAIFVLPMMAVWLCLIAYYNF